MTLELNNKYSGFKVNKITRIEEINATGYEMQHEFSGAKLFFLENKDDNKVFTIGFRTPSEDDTGVAHITEHSVLCGSRKYQLKEPFVELVKGSLNTFLNAMTYSDKTVYPVASRNQKDFKNLMDVYLDAVFYPLIYNNPFTLMQEGWHYEIDEETNELHYNGVVYNEMKGVYSSYDAIEEHEINKALFTDSPYRFESGGFPEAIPNLIQEKFENFHKKYYSPENAYIYLYGDVEIESTLEYLDKEYLQAFPKSGKLNVEIPLQKPFEFTKEIKASYPIDSDETTVDKTYLSMNIVTGTATDLKTIAALKLLCSVLLEGNSAPLRLALLEAGICSDVSGNFASSQLQPVFSIELSGSSEEHRDKFVKVLYKTLQDITIKGLDKELIEASLNATEFKLREADFGVYPKGLIYGLTCMETWLYGADPTEGLKIDELLSFLRKKTKGRYYESLIENYLLDNTHKVLLTLVPQKGLEEKHQAHEAKRMEEVKSKLSTEEILDIKTKKRELMEKQAKPDSAEALSSIPVLEREDITQTIEKEASQITTNGEQSILYLPQFTNKILYYNWYFDLSNVSEDLMPYMYLMTDVLGKLNTKEYSYTELPTITNKYTGGVAFEITPYTSASDLNDCSIRFCVRAKVLEENKDKLFEILRNVALTTDFSDKKRLKDILEEVKTDWDSQFFNRGLSVGLVRLSSYFSKEGKIKEYDQLTYYKLIKELVENFDKNVEMIQNNLKILITNLFHQDKLLFAYSCDENLADSALKAAQNFMDLLPHSSFKNDTFSKLKEKTCNEAIITSGKVQYVLAGGDFKKAGFEYTGAMKVLETILRYGYLWTKIRVQGGAYGANVRFETNGSLFFNSYRDPQLLKTLEAYRELPDYLSSFSATDREMTKYVIGTMSSLDVPLTNSMHLERASTLYLRKITDEMRQKNRNEVLNVTEKDIRNLAPLIEAVLAQNLYCVVGSKEAITVNKEIFNDLIQ